MELYLAVVNQVYVSISLAHVIKRFVSAKYSWSVSQLLPIVLNLSVYFFGL